jgi:hypothetical protein
MDEAKRPEPPNVGDSSTMIQWTVRVLFFM